MENDAGNSNTEEHSEKSAPHDEIEKTSHQAALLKQTIDKTIRLDPTRYGDWEKNGRCIDF